MSRDEYLMDGSRGLTWIGKRQRLRCGCCIRLSSCYGTVRPCYLYQSKHRSKITLFQNGFVKRKVIDWTELAMLVISISRRQFSYKVQIPLRWRSLTGGAFKNSLGGSHSAVVGHVATRGCFKTKCYTELCSQCRVPCLTKFIAVLCSRYYGGLFCICLFRFRYRYVSFLWLLPMVDWCWWFLLRLMASGIYDEF